jgi:predicted nucleotidyltransferase
MLTRSQVLDLLRPLKPELAKRYRVRGLALFGSLARQEQGPTSDLDLLADFAAGATLFDLVGLGLFLKEKLVCPVHVVPRRALRPSCGRGPKSAGPGKRGWGWALPDHGCMWV